MARATSLSPQDFHLLDQWARQLREAFDETPYLVGSTLTGGAYRDVDVRMLLPDDASWIAATALRVRVVNLSVTMWGRQLTGLPIDFQFQPTDVFHAEDGNRRSALGIRAQIEADREAVG